MYVPPFVPQPIEIPGNVAEAPYLDRLKFIRRVALFHFLTVVITFAMALLPLPPASPTPLALMVLCLLTLMSLVRGLGKGRDADQRFSVFLLPATLLALAVWFRSLYDQGWAVWALGFGVLCAVGYIALCGKDLSFVGMFVIAFLTSSIAISGAGWWIRIDGHTLATALGLNAAFLFYYVYDLAALLTRRRLGEEWGAVADLYRDVLNGLTYPVRVYHHWRENNIWSPPKEWFR